MSLKKKKKKKSAPGTPKEQPSAILLGENKYVRQIIWDMQDYHSAVGECKRQTAPPKVIIRQLLRVLSHGTDYQWKTLQDQQQRAWFPNPNRGSEKSIWSYLSGPKTQLESPSSPGNRHFRILVRSQTTYGIQHTEDCFLEVITEHGCLTMVYNMKNVMELLHEWYARWVGERVWRERVYVHLGKVPYKETKPETWLSSREVKHLHTGKTVWT